jgi:hypothetical protein
MEENTLLHRQVHPSFVQNDIISTQAFVEDKAISSLAFNPSEKDNNKLSVYNGEKYSATDAYNHYTVNYSSCGVLSVTVSECNTIDKLEAVEDNYPFNGHSYIDFSAVESKAKKKKKAGVLRDFAVKRNWTYKK